MSDEFYNIIIDKPLGESEPECPSHVYPINCGYVEGVKDSNGNSQQAYVIGVEVALDTFYGKKVAVVHRRDSDITSWVIAPDNMPFAKQQIEEMIDFEEKYYDSYIEIVNDEIWDAYNADEICLGYTVPRSMAKSLPEGVYHVVVMVYTKRKDGCILTTQRSRNKTNPLKWEVSGGSILAGENPKEGAVRELCEETGIKKSVDELVEIYRYVDHNRHCIYHGYKNEVDNDVEVHLQLGETMDYQFLPYNEFTEFVKSDRFVSSERGRFIMFEDILEKCLKG